MLIFFVIFYLFLRVEPVGVVSLNSWWGSSWANLLVSIDTFIIMVFESTKEFPFSFLGSILSYCVALFVKTEEFGNWSTEANKTIDIACLSMYCLKLEWKLVSQSHQSSFSRTLSRVVMLPLFSVIKWGKKWEGCIGSLTLLIFDGVASLKCVQTCFRKAGLLHLYVCVI